MDKDVDFGLEYLRIESKDLESVADGRHVGDMLELI